MFARLGQAVSRHPWVFLITWLILAGLAGTGAFWGFGHDGLFARMTNSESLVSGSESDDVSKLTAPASQGETITVVVSGVDLANDTALLGGFMDQHRGDLADVVGVARETDPFTGLLSSDSALQAQALALISQNQDGFLIGLTLDAHLDTAALDQTHADLVAAVSFFGTTLAAQFPGAQATQMSTGLLGDAIIGQVQSDLVVGEAVSLPVALFLLVIVFGGVLAAGLPLAGAILSIVIGLGAVWGLTFLMNVDSFLLNVISIIGVALSIDYGLLVVSRYREELAVELAAKGYPVDGRHVPRKFAAKAIVQAATARTVATAGRTVTFSAVTIAFAIAALLVMQSDMLRTMALAGIVVTLLAVLMAIMVVPALIVLSNRVLIKPSVLTRVPGLRRVLKAVGDSSSDRGIFSRLARWVHRHPWWIMLGVLIVLAVMASPIRDLTMRTDFTDYLPPGQAVTDAYDTIQADYPAVRSASIVVVADLAPDRAGALVDHLNDLSADVDFVSPPAALPEDPNRTVINVHLDVDNQVGTTVTDQVKALRAYDAGVPLMIGGPAALQLDFIDSIIARAPQALGIMAGAVLILLFLMTGSLIVPLKALIINSLSLIASLGTTSWIFAHGYLGMPQTLGMEAFILACAVAFGFGLAMDYEVFLLARIKETWDTGADNNTAVERGLQRSGRIITSAAAIIVAVFIGFTFGNMIAIKQIGVALAVTVVTDASLVRLLLVPATMTILGKWNWWAPKPLRWLYGKLGIIH